MAKEDIVTAGRRPPRDRFKPAGSRNPRQDCGGIRLEERDEALLCDLFLHRLMTRGQIERSYFTSTGRCNARLRQLFDHHFVGRYFPPYAPFGAQAVYSLGKAALPLVARRLEIELPEVARYYRRTRTPTFIEHALSVVDIWLSFREALSSEPALSIDLWLAEMQCRHEWEIRSPGGHWCREAFKPDAFIRLRQSCSDLRSEEVLHSFFIEADLGHTSARQFTGKLHTHSRYLKSGLFDQTYGCSSFHTLVITTGERRLANLQALSAVHGSDFFWFSTFERIAEASTLAPVWSQPGRQGQHALVCPI